MENQENQTNQPVNKPTPAQGQQAVPSTMENRTILAVLAYLGPLVAIPFFLGKYDQFVKFHTRQGLVVFSLEVIVWVLGMIAWPLWMLWSLINLAAVVLSVIGIINAGQGKEKELPLVGKFSRHFPV